MSKYITVDSVVYPISTFTLRLRRTADLSSTSYLLRCTLHTLTDNTALDDTLAFYSDGSLIYSGTVDVKGVESSAITIESTKQLAGTPTTHTIDELFFYSSESMRFPLDFDVLPYDTIQTPVGNFTVDTIVHYEVTSEVTYG